MLIYLFGSLGSVFLWKETDTEVSLIAMLYFCCGLFILLYPILRLGESQCAVIPFPEKKYLYCIAIILITSQLFCIIYYIPKLIDGLTGDLGVNRSMVSNQFSRGQGDIDPRAYLATLAAFLYSVSITLGIYWLGFEKRKVFGFFLLLGSLSYFVYTAAFVGRDGVVFWIFSVTTNAFLFWKYLSSRIRALLLFSFLFIFVVMVILFANITISRFFDGSRSVSESLYNYYCQPVIKFNEQFELDVPTHGGQAVFPLLYFIAGKMGILTYDSMLLIDRQLDNIKYIDYDINVFSTLLGSFVLDLGKTYALIVCLCVSVILTKYLKKNEKQKTLGQIIALTTYWQVMFTGWFYFVQGSTYGNASLLLTAMLCVSCDYFQKATKI